MPNTWIMEQSETRVLVTRRKPVRWDVEAWSEFPRCHALRLAHQIRQDMWRALQKIKGFCPAVEIELGETFHVRAGGRVARHVHPLANGWVEDLLNHDVNRRRWLAFARDNRYAVPASSRDLGSTHEAPGQARGARSLDA